jgi:hypothetical protein
VEFFSVAVTDKGVASLLRCWTVGRQESIWSIPDFRAYPISDWGGVTTQVAPSRSLPPTPLRFFCP